MHMPLPMQTMQKRNALRSRRKALWRNLRGCLENVSDDVATNPFCHVGSVGNVDCQKRFVAELTNCLLRKDSGPALVLIMTLAALSAHRDRGVLQ